MEVQVTHALAAVLPHVGDNTVALFAAQFFAKAGNGGKHMGQQSAVFLPQLCGGIDVGLGITKKWTGAWGSMS